MPFMMKPDSTIIPITFKYGKDLTTKSINFSELGTYKMLVIGVIFSIK
jgi:hypothetical protein